MFIHYKRNNKWHYWHLKHYLLYYLCETSRNYLNLWVFYPLRSVRLSRFYFANSYCEYKIYFLRHFLLPKVKHPRNSLHHEKTIIDTIEQIGYTNCRTSRRCRNLRGFNTPSWFFFAFTAYSTSTDCISLVCLFTINETTNGIIDIWSIICYIICARQFVVNITSGYFILCVQCDCLVFILRGKEKYRFSVDKVPLLWKNVHNRRIAIIERFLIV